LRRRQKNYVMSDSEIGKSENGVQLGCRHGSKDGNEDDGDTHVDGLMDWVWVGWVEFVSRNRVS
jgi:hypothetical protein